MSSSCLIMTSSDFYSKFIDNKNETDKYNNTNDDDTSSSSVNNNESLASSLASSSSSSSPLLLNKKRKMMLNIQSMKNKKRQRRRADNSVRVQRVVQFVPNSNLMTDVAFPRKNAAIPQQQKKAKTTRMNQGEGGDEDEDEHHESSSTTKKNNDALWYTAQEMQTFKYSFIRDVQRYERQQQRRQCCYDYNSINDSGADADDSEGLERYTTYHRVRRRQKRKGMVQICQAVQAFEQSTLLLPTTKVQPLTELLGQLLQRYHQSQQSSQS